MADDSREQKYSSPPVVVLVGQDKHKGGRYNSTSIPEPSNHSKCNKARKSTVSLHFNSQNRRGAETTRSSVEMVLSTISKAKPNKDSVFSAYGERK